MKLTRLVAITLFGVSSTGWALSDIQHWGFVNEAKLQEVVKNDNYLEFAKAWMPENALDKLTAVIVTPERLDTVDRYTRSFARRQVLDEDEAALTKTFKFYCDYHQGEVTRIGRTQFCLKAETPIASVGWQLHERSGVEMMIIHRKGQLAEKMYTFLKNIQTGDEVGYRGMTVLVSNKRGDSLVEVFYYGKAEWVRADLLFPRGGTTF